MDEAGVLARATSKGSQSIELSDLLGRPAINLDTPELQRFLAGKRVLVTGAGGSIGSEICRQSMKFCPQRILLLERAENALFEIDRELRHNWVGADIRPCIADMCDAPRINQIFQTERPQVVFHAAAHKHVPLMEHNPCEAIKNNIFGTKIVADAALAAGVAVFVMVSTDKAVNPTSVMGATKRFAELYAQALNGGSGFRVQGSGKQKPEARSQKPEEKWEGSMASPGGTLSSCLATRNSQLATDSSIQHSAFSIQHSSQHSALSTQHSPPRFVAVRFGNVLGSSGSVVPIFQKQIEAGGPVTVTHPDMQRYFMTIPEASQLVMQAGAVAQGGEIFVLDMGKPMRILDLAMELVRRNGLRPNDDIEIRFTGIRPGEKLYEELACDNEQTRPTSHPKIRVWQLPPADIDEVMEGLALLQKAAQCSARDAIAALMRCVPEYQPDRADVRTMTKSNVNAAPLRLVSSPLATEAA